MNHRDSYLQVDLYRMRPEKSQKGIHPNLLRQEIILIIYLKLFFCEYTLNVESCYIYMFFFYLILILVKIPIRLDYLIPVEFCRFLLSYF